MKTYTKRILLSVTGMSPAVVTETLYSLVTERNFIPTEIRVITTEQGKNKLLDALLGIEGGRKERVGALAEFIADYGEKYGFSTIHFDESCIEVIQDEMKQNLADIRSPNENNLAANQIIGLVGKLCQDEQSQLHVSIAGGRKTMGFFLGYALSLYGREQDSLSHVLVEEQFENVKNFFYPKPTEYLVNNHKGELLNAQKAKVMLADIPWVRLGLGVPDNLINQQISYSESVQKAQKLIDTPSLTFLSPMDNKLVLFGEMEIKLSPRSYSFLLSLVISKIQDFKYKNVYREKDQDSEKVINTYSTILDYISTKEKSAIVKELKLELTQPLADAKDGIKKKIQENFSISKTRNHPYIPSAKNGIYTLNIDLENIDISAIKTTLIEDLHLL